MSKKLEAYYGLPEKVIYCSHCVMSNQRPASTIEFQHNKNSKKVTLNINDSGLCDACQYAQIKKAILNLRDNPQLLADMKKNGRETAKNFDWGKLIQKYKNYFQKLIDTYDSSAKRPRFRYLELMSHKKLLEVIEQKAISQNPIKYSKNLATPRETLEIFRFYAKQHGFGKAMKECWKWFFK